MYCDHLINFGETWFHFYINPNRGLCVNKKQDSRFVFSACLLKNAYNDFTVCSDSHYMHIVAQTNDGSMHYVRFNGESKTEATLMESRDKSPFFKNLTLFNISGFLNLLYVIPKKETLCLVHQILNGNDPLPKIIDTVNDLNFQVVCHKTSNFTVLYQQQNNKLGTRQYQWSKKAFHEFIPFDCGCHLNDAHMLIDDNDTIHIVGFATFDKFTNIIYAKKHMEDYALSAVHLVAGSTAAPILTQTENHTLSIGWCENGLFMTCNCEDGKKWSKPKKYLCGNTQKNSLFCVHLKNQQIHVYGSVQDTVPTFYQQLLISPFSSAKNKAASTPSSNSEKNTYRSELDTIKKLMSGQNDVIAEMLKKINALERAAAKAEADAKTAKNLSPLQE